MSVAINEFRLSIASAIVNKLKGDMLQDHIDFMLSILPEGTKVANITELPITGLSKDTLIGFEHPLFDALPGSHDTITKIETKTVRVAWKNPNDTIGQASLFKGIDYLTASGKKVFDL